MVLAWGWCHEGSLGGCVVGFCFIWLAGWWMVGGGSGDSYWDREGEHDTVGGRFVGMEMLCVGKPWCFQLDIAGLGVVCCIVML